jgi:hypothetical protein
MCFNPTVSLIAFSISFFSTIYLIYLKLYSGSIITSYLALIQLLEYYSHISINKDKNLNVLSAKLIFIIVFLQPFLIYISTIINTKNINLQMYNYKNTHKYSLYIFLLYIIFGFFFYNDINNKQKFKTEYLTCSSINDSITSVCRLRWIFFEYNPYYSIIFILFYLGICLMYSIKDILHIISIILIFIAIIYSIFFTKQLKISFGLFGSIWCFLAVIYGPFYILL